MAIYTIAISGASGAPYALRLLQVLVKGGHSIYLSISGNGLSILNDETGLMLKGSETDIQFALEKHLEAKEGQISYFDEDNMYAAIASGSVKVDAMVVIPCSMKTLSALAHGYCIHAHRAGSRCHAEGETKAHHRTARDAALRHSSQEPADARGIGLPHHSGHARVLPSSQEDFRNGRFYRWKGAGQYGGRERPVASVGDVR